MKLKLRSTKFAHTLKIFVRLPVVEVAMTLD